MSPIRRRRCKTYVQTVLAVSERRACRALGQPRSTQCHRTVVPDDEAPLTAVIVRLATQFGRYGNRRITALLRTEGCSVNHKRVERIWRREGLKVAGRQPKRGRLWLTDGSCNRLRPVYWNHVWACDLVTALTHPGVRHPELTARPDGVRQPSESIG